MSKKCDKLPQIRISKGSHEKLKRIASTNPFQPKIGTLADMAIEAWQEAQDMIQEMKKGQKP